MRCFTMLARFRESSLLSTDSATQSAIYVELVSGDNYVMENNLLDCLSG